MEREYKFPGTFSPLKRFICKFLFPNLQHGWVASKPVDVLSCNSVHDLQQRMSNISDALRHNETFADSDLKVVVLNLNESIDVAPPQLMGIFEELKEAVFQYAALATQFNLNAADALSQSIKQFITSDSRIVDAFDRDPTSFNDTHKLTAARALIDSARNATGNFTESIAKRYQEMKLSVMPNEVEIIAELAELTNNLSEATLVDSDTSLKRVREFIKKIQAATDYIEVNIKPQKIRFRYVTDKLAFAVERKLRKMGDGIYKLLPVSVK